jgi:hypothetical protein
MFIVTITYIIEMVLANRSSACAPGSPTKGIQPQKGNAMFHSLIEVRRNPHPFATPIEARMEDFAAKRTSDRRLAAGRNGNRRRPCRMDMILRRSKDPDTGNGGPQWTLLYLQWSATQTEISFIALPWPQENRQDSNQRPADDFTHHANPSNRPASLPLAPTRERLSVGRLRGSPCEKQKHHPVAAM